ncbi:RagB/SusD family nutrient uptake outer membrane protein [Flammeovirga sp. EKP202]|uniref:RagB/SusD family nutrient uptake outer membrane protein n=1 Tax=Flammeovirga sp. EKP202 TaxID=2770592 RepID=UPI00165FE455|nr:RagB/SusD family nutrient uptake outer membrane protein [Flammeovirga sp. EKP202]MBD0401956.1 RagB/SusD family nutrient uptake outer membrane protein [Flammeovirga sp. EKP202]
MKKNRIKWSAVLLLGMLTACDDFLNVEPKSKWTTDHFYNTEKTADVAIAGMMSQLMSANAFGDNLSMAMVYGTDEGYYSRGWDDNWPVSTNTHVSNSEAVEETWRTLYTTVNNANLLIHQMNPEDFSVEKYNFYIAEAKFLRAFAYQNLALWWNEVPLRVKPTMVQSDNLMAAASQKAVYGQIVEDYQFAMEHLPHAQDEDYIPGRPNKMAAEGLLARAYMKMAGHPMKMTNYYDSALVHLDNIIYKDAWHALRTSDSDTLGYRLLFLDYIGGIYDLKESMFEISYQNNLAIGMPGMSYIGNRNGLTFDYQAVGHPGTSHRSVQVSPVLDLKYEGVDKRRQWNIPGIQYNKFQKVVRVTNIFAAQYTPGKFRRWEPVNWADVDENNEVEEYVLLTGETIVERNLSPINFPILRFSDVLLMYAEASNEKFGTPTPEAVECLNRIRRRAGLEEIERSNPEKIASKEAFFEELVDERLREFAFEGIRKHDLIRWGKLEEKLQELDEVMKSHPDYDPAYWTIPGISRCINNFNPSKHLELPYPLQEINVNTALKQKPNW